ncbi:hypothetical protein [Pseudomonas umsongensis]|uniref:hypothetical protein n=1 Tax=Pseudomonas umsongensis TaxID=198618 RepID=UPI001CDB58B5
MSCVDFLERVPNPDETQVRDMLSGIYVAARATPASSRPCSKSPPSAKRTKGYNKNVRSRTQLPRSR